MIVDKNIVIGNYGRRYKEKNSCANIFVVNLDVTFVY